MDRAARLILVGTSHHATPLDVRERLAICAGRMAEFAAGIQAVAGIRESVLLTTCNRLELYAVAARAASEDAIADFICRFQGFPAQEFAQHRYTLRDADAVRHLVEVASGVDSQLVGETEILGQVKAAYAAASERGTVGPVLNRVFQKGFQAAKLIRSSTPIGAGQVSVANVAVDLAEKIFGDLGTCRVLVLGTGEVGEKTIKALHSRGVTTITVLSRTQARADTLAAMVGARAGLLDGIPTALPAHDIVIGCTTAQTPVVSAAVVQATSRARRLRPLFLIDLGIPRNIERAAGELDSVFLYDLDDLARIADENLALRRAAVDRCRQLARERGERIWHGVLPRLQAAAAVETAPELTPREQVT